MSLAGGPPLLNERCTSLLRAPRLRNDIYCVERDDKLYYTIPSEINGDFRQKSPFISELNFYKHIILPPPLREFPLQLCNGVTVQKLNSCPTRWSKEVADMCVRFDTIPACDGRTDRQTDRSVITLSCSACL